jgi:hypothetical protein
MVGTKPNSLRDGIMRQVKRDFEERERWENKHFRWTLGDRADLIECRLVEVEPVDYPEDEAEFLRSNFKSKKARLVTSPGAEVVWLSTIRVGNARNH